MKRIGLKVCISSILIIILFATSASAITMYAPNGRIASVADEEVQNWKDVGWYDYPVTTVYAPDGRTTVIATVAVSAWINVGWYVYPVTTVYARDGRSAVIAKDEVYRWKQVGWYENPSIVMYAPDGRTANVAFSDVDAWKKVGWYESCSEAVKSNLVGNWDHYETEELMEHHSIYVTFREDGTFYASTWRCRYYGTYKVNGNNIDVNYDMYFCGAGGVGLYIYYESDIWSFEMKGNRLYSDDEYYVKNESLERANNDPAVKCR